VVAVTGTVVAVTRTVVAVLPTAIEERPAAPTRARAPSAEMAVRFLFIFGNLAHFQGAALPQVGIFLPM
jgi:hypothetical protein